MSRSEDSDSEEFAEGAVGGMRDPVLSRTAAEARETRYRMEEHMEELQFRDLAERQEALELATLRCREAIAEARQRDEEETRHY